MHLKRSALAPLVTILALMGATPSLAHEPNSEAGAEPGAEAPPEIRAVATEEEIRVDGVFDEDVWQSAPVADGFTQRNPDPGEPVSQRTEFQVAFTNKLLVFAIRAYDDDPTGLVAKEMQRDGAIFRDDGLLVLLDTFHDHRNAYFFETNPNGAKTDSLMTDEGRQTNFQWDGIWTVGTQRTEEGWTAEIAIPFSTLRFDPAKDTWGLQIRRVVRRQGEFAFWAPTGLEANLWRASIYGHLTGIEPPKPGLNLQVKPFATGTAEDSSGGSSSEDLELGLDIKWGLTRNLTLDLTYNTDFAEVESDNLEVNLTRFSLFFPEKREFFLENSGIFAFGPGAPTLDLFFSRRIGISPGGAEVPVEWGARLSGRSGPWNVGFLDAQTEETDDVPTTNWAVARVERNLGERSTVGVLVTNKDEGGSTGSMEGGSGDNRAFGFDANLYPTDRLNVTAFLAKTDSDREEDSDEEPAEDPSADDDEWAAGVGVEYRGGIWDWEIEAQEIRGGFDPAMGFVRRTGVRRYTSELSYEPRSKNEKINSYDFGLETEVVTRIDDSLESMELEFRLFGLRLRSADDLFVFAEHFVEDLISPFEIRLGVVIAPGRYDFQNLTMVFESNSSRAVSTEVVARVGSFYDGDRTSTTFVLRLRPNRFLQSETLWGRNDIDLPAGAFATDLVRQRLSVAFSPSLFLNGFVQYSDASELLAANLRFNWIYRPGADLFLVFNQTWNAPSLGDLSSKDRQVILKFTYLFDW